MAKLPQMNNAVGPQIGQPKRNTDKVIRVVVVGSALLIGSFIATQYFAYIHQYSPSLGGSVKGVYFPGMVYYWLYLWGQDLAQAFRRAFAFGGMATGVILLAYLIISRITHQSARVNQYLHGSAHWATEKEIREAGILGNSEGVYVGAWKDEKGVTHYLRDSGPSHVLCFAPTRSGKGVGLVLPTLLSWKASCVISDLKGELWALTSGWRKNHADNTVLRFEPGAADGCARWNPLDEVRLGTPNESGDIRGLTNIIIDPLGKGIDDFWTKSAADLLDACITHLLYKRAREGTPANMKTLCFMLANPHQSQEELFIEMTTFGHYEDGRVNEAVASQGAAMLKKPENERGSVISTMQSCLGIYRDPVVAANTETCDFKIMDLMNSHKPVSLYMITTPDQKSRLTPLLRLLLTMMIQQLAANVDFQDGRTVMAHKHRLLMMLDEFPSFGNLPMLAEAPSYVAGYGIKMYFITQDTVQLADKYGDKHSIASNCHIKIAFPPNRPETAKYLSELVGKTTVTMDQYTESGKRTAMIMGQVSRSMQMTGRELLTPDEAMQLPGPKKDAKGDIVEAGDMIVIVSGFAPIYGKQPLYFKDETFLARAKIPAPEFTDTITIEGPPPEKVAL